MTSIIRSLLFTLFLIGQAFGATSPLVIIGGGLDEANQSVYNQLIDLAGGKNKANLAIFGTNSGYPEDSMDFNQEVFESRYGIKTTRMPLDKAQMEQIENAIEKLKKKHALKTTQELNAYLGKASKLPASLALIQSLKETTGIYFGGGDQSRSKNLFFREDGSETYLLSFMRHRMANGVVFSGTSAGAAMQSHPMITSGYSVSSLRRTSDEVTFEKGFGFLNNVIVDQHFGQRGRLGRLLASMHRANVHIGAGIDEDTALVIHEGKWIVRGSGQVYLVKLNPNGSIQDANLTVLSEGDVYDPRSEKVTVDTSKTLQEEDLKLRKGTQLHSGKTFESLEIERAIKELQESPNKTIKTWNAPGRKGVGMGFSISESTRFYQNTSSSKVTAENLKIKLLNVPNLQKNFPPNKSCFDLLKPFIN